ncbi:MAG: hypothetical protein J7L96_08695 [Bacteroidales bacterium]|nr:hypothetical protein [Bacteroidales bacterium]
MSFFSELTTNLYKRKILAVSLLLLFSLNCTGCGSADKDSAGPKLKTIEIDGPFSLPENSSADYLCKAYFTDGTVQPVVPESWHIDCPEVAVISENGHLSSFSVEANKICRISAICSDKGAGKRATRSIIIRKELILDNSAMDADFSSGKWRISEGVDPYEKESLESIVPSEPFIFKASVKGPYQISIWWTTTDDRCSAVPIEIYDDSILLDTVYIDQRANGGMWNTLLSEKYLFNGTAKVKIISNSTDNCSTCADAVKFNYINYYVAFGDSITKGFGDDDPTDNISADKLTVGGGYPPILDDLLTRKTKVPYIIANEGIGGIQSKGGVEALDKVIARHPEAMLFLVQFGTNDSWYKKPRRSGQGLQSGDSKFPGSFKSNMQQIITTINRAGKKVCLAKLPIALGDNVYSEKYSRPDKGLKNKYIKQYNQVIDELAQEPQYGIMVPPPDFYSYFNTKTQCYRYSDEYIDNIHPNGAGYRSIAQLWCQALTQ